MQKNTVKTTQKSLISKCTTWAMLVCFLGICITSARWAWAQAKVLEANEHYRQATAMQYHAEKELAEQEQQRVASMSYQVLTQEASTQGFQLATSVVRLDTNAIASR